MAAFVPANSSSKKILIVTGDCPSHPYACSKLATVLVEHHDVTVAGPNGMALSRLQVETKRHNEAASSKKQIKCRSIGDVSTLVHCNVRSVVNAQDYSPVRIIFDTLFKRSYVPYGFANDFEQLMDDQVGTYENLKRLLPEYDLVYAIHTAAGTVCDALESLQQEGAASVPPCIIFSSLPYNSHFMYKKLWTTPRSLVALPHVATYSLPRKAFEQSGFFLLGLVSYLVQLFWMCLDTYHVERAWKLASKRTDERRASRGLPPVRDAMRYYFMKYPLLSVGGTEPFIAEGERIADNATVIGAIKSSVTSDLDQLNEWFDRANVNGIVYASFGTGTQLSTDEATNVANLAISLVDTDHHLLFSLPRTQQERFRLLFDEVIGSGPSNEGAGFIEYMNGLLRIDDDVPQENLLMSDKVKLFVSHMGFGGYTEAVYGGVPFVAYPSGCDQWYNTERAVEAGIAVRANSSMEDLDFTVQCALVNDSLRERARQLAIRASNFDSNQIILDMASEICEGVAAKRRSSSTSTCSLSTDASN